MSIIKIDSSFFFQVVLTVASALILAALVGYGNIQNTTITYKKPWKFQQKLDDKDLPVNFS